MLNRLPKQVPYWISIENLTSSFSHQNTCSAHRHLVLSMFSWVSFKNALFRMKLTSSSRSTSLYAWTSVFGSTDPQSASCDSLWSKRIVHSLDSCVDQGTHFSGLQEELIVWGKELYHLGLWPFLERGLAGRGRIITDGEVAGGGGGRGTEAPSSKTSTQSHASFPRIGQGLSHSCIPTQLSHCPPSDSQSLPGAQQRKHPSLRS